MNRPAVTKQLGRPSTHILKIDDSLRPGLIDAEYHALLVAGEIGMSSSDPTLLEVAGRHCLIVRRFDRSIVDGAVRRVHQEHVCQALGMYIGGVADLARVDRDALIREATGWKMNKQTAITTIDQTLELLRTAVIRHDELARLVATNPDRIQRQLLHD